MSDNNSNSQNVSEGSQGIYRKAKSLLPLNVRIFLRTRLLRLGNRLSQLDRPLLASKYLQGDGIEIGALHAPLQVGPAANVKYVDRLNVPELRKLYPELESYEIVQTDILDDGQYLATIGDESKDFVIANHFLEHCPNPLEALRNIHRVLKVGGLFFLALPDKRFTFDVDRPVTSFDHLLKDFQEGPEWSKRGHYEEWVNVVSKPPAEDAEAQMQDLMEKEVWIHFHVWTQSEMFELLANIRKTLGLNFEIECFLKNAAECIFILRKNNSLSDGGTTP